MGLYASLFFTKWYDIFILWGASSGLTTKAFFFASFHLGIRIKAIPNLFCQHPQVKSLRSCLLLEAQAAAANPENKPILLRDLERRGAEDQATVDCLQHLLCGMFYMLEWTLLFLIFLVVIGFNVWNLLAALTGLTLGYMLFGRGRLN